ncbi:MAG: YqgE/AlgH family protein [Bacteroidia bacterium]|nr:MAG: YqgE/AlgH family protein [Bacteroidia bacterium]
MGHYADIFSINPEDKIPGKGRVLISEPFLTDSFFNRTIVFLTEHTPEGTVGFILNRVIDLKVCNAVDGFDGWDEPLSIGGPVASDTLHYLHSLGLKVPGSVAVVPGIWWGGEIDALRNLIATGTVSHDQVRFFLGYSGWEKGQLKKELNDNSWVIARAPAEVIMKSRGNVWKEVLRSLHSKYRIWAEFPESPEMN